MSFSMIQLEPLLVQGNALLSARRDSDALSCFQQARQFAPATGAAIVGQCRAMLRLGHIAEASVLLDRTLLEQPELEGADGLMAQMALLRGCAEEAWKAATRGRARIPQDPVALLVMGRLILERRDRLGALDVFDEALTADPQLAAAHLGRGDALAVLGRLAESLDALRTAASLDPNNAAIPVRIGHLLICMNQFDRADESFLVALDLDAHSPAALQGHAQCLTAIGRAPEALIAYTRLLEVAPEADYMRGERFHLQLHCCDWQNFEERRRDLIECVRRGERADNPGSFMAHTDSPSDQLRCAQIFASDAYQIADRAFAPKQRRAGERIRVAYLSADFHEHPTAFLAAGLFEAHDRSAFETYGISFGPDDGGPTRQRLMRAFEHFDDVRHLSDREVAERLYDYDIDVAVDLKGHTLGARPQIFAFRPAPVQVSFLGYPGTLGSGLIDYLVADRTVIAEADLPYYAERVIYVPGSYQVNDAARTANPTPTRRAAGLPEAGFVFCCFNSPYKITPEIFDDWMTILREVSGSVLWLLEANAAATANLRQEAARRQVSPDRLIFAPWLEYHDHLARCAWADLFLDTRPYNAHTTASDALWSAVPVITHPGASFASRVATSLLRAVGLERLSVASRDEYRDLAVRIARSPAELEVLKHQLVTVRHTSALFDSVGYCRHLEAAFRQAVELSRRGVS